MNRQRIRISESELRQLIRESIQEEIDNGNLDEGFFSNFGKIVGNDIKNGAKNMFNRAKAGIGNAYNKGKEAAGNAYNRASDYYQNTKQQAQLATNKEDAQRLLNDLAPFVEKGIIKQNIYNMIKGNLQKYIQQ